MTKSWHIRLITKFSRHTQFWRKYNRRFFGMLSMETKNIGLRGIEIADTKISNIDGEKGKLIYRGYDILDLTKNSTFEETAYLLIYDSLPNKTIN